MKENGRKLSLKNTKKEKFRVFVLDACVCKENLILKIKNKFIHLLYYLIKSI